MNKVLHSVIAETLSKKSTWMASSDPFSSAMTFALKALHQRGALITSGEFSLSHLKHQSRKAA